METRVRIAPSPTGYLHVGTARTALYNYLFAKKHSGKFILRIEDTDRERSSDEMTEIIKEGLKWLGIDWDEGPFFQSEYFEHYREFIPQMEKTGQVYKCFCSKEELNERRQEAMNNKKAWRYDRKCLELSDEEVKKRVERGDEFVYRIRIPEGKTSFEDMVHGTIEKDNSEIDDFILFRSDGSPVYNLAVVIDDARMNITHVIRGDDHISNTFKQIHIYKLIGKDIPQFGHLPLILDEQKHKLSKRSGTVSVLAFRDMGILPEAFVNFIALIGWNPGGEEEYFTMEELVEKFSIDRVTGKGGVFDIKKLEWMNARYITQCSNERLYGLLKPIYAENSINLDDYDRQYIYKIFDSVKEKARYVNEFPSLTDFYFADIDKYEEKGVKKYINPERIEHLKVLKSRMESMEDYTEESIENIYRAYAEEQNLKAADVIHPTRLALTGRTVGPSLFELMEILGSKTVRDRLTKFTESDIL
ncbi:MAG: glutamate--tRNA ligase [bacterium]